MCRRAASSSANLVSMAGRAHTVPASPSTVSHDKSGLSTVECPETKCCKKFRDYSALLYHRMHAHKQSTASSVASHVGRQDAGMRKRKCNDASALECEQVNESDERSLRESDRPAQSLRDSRPGAAGIIADAVSHQRQHQTSDAVALNATDTSRCVATVDCENKCESPVGIGTQATSNTQHGDHRHSGELMSREHAALSSRQLHAAVEYIQQESRRQAYLQMIDSYAPAASSFAHLMSAAAGSCAAGDPLTTATQSQPLDMTCLRHHHAASSMCTTAATTTAATVAGVNAVSNPTSLLSLICSSASYTYSAPLSQQAIQ